MASSSNLVSARQPPFIYGTAWKKDQTAVLVKEAVRAGFRAVDTAAQPRHYQEDLVGKGLREAYSQGLVRRDGIYLQTKYTSPAGQDLNNMPYNHNDPLEAQIRTSVASSLRNLSQREDSDADSYIDCLLLHSPLPTVEMTLDAWKILETYVPHKIRKLGISNVNLAILEAIWENSTVKPSVVQNRFYPATKYDVPLRRFCRRNNITYQSFWTLTGNPNLLKSKPVASLSAATGMSKSVALYCLVVDLGVQVLNGTTSVAHMQEDLAGIAGVREWATVNQKEWIQISHSFNGLVAPSLD